ncbi:rhodanese-like domain-containing protein [Paludibacterium paludis]|uniref:Sulfurtransferase n=1 Tax=Paludibacterium paludis TaxID=1225769 RepID=A0A918UB72_9NEIS|nr:rhodanese-like domain-containing protein [Paludibacterium paludis]GGY27066.1 sulfurtransferase [Paludibacterium paludis]
MSHVNEILKRAHERGLQEGVAYAGVLTPQEACFLAGHMESARIVDVRSAAEWQFVGVVPDAVRIELKTWPGMQPNPNFDAQLTHQVDKEAVVMFLCRTGGRSDEAASRASALGFTAAFNIQEGFEGRPDGEQHRGTVDGWKARGLPWVQP